MMEKRGKSLPAVQHENSPSRVLQAASSMPPTAAQLAWQHQTQQHPRQLRQRKLSDIANGRSGNHGNAQQNAAAETTQLVSGKVEHRRRALQSAELSEEEEKLTQAKRKDGSKDGSMNDTTASPGLSNDD